MQHLGPTVGADGGRGLPCSDPRGRHLLTGSPQGRQRARHKSRATEIALEAAVRARPDPIVHVSSYVALLPSDDVLTPNSPVGVGGPAYPRSKAQSELVARRYQSAGAAVVTTYPGAVAGPHDPYFGDTAFTLSMILRNRVPFALPGRWTVAEVGYVAGAHAAMLEPGRGPRRYLLGGHNTTWNDLHASLRTSPDTGSRPSRRPAPWPGPAAGQWIPSSDWPRQTLLRLPATVDHHPVRRHRQHDHPSGTRDRTTAARADTRGHDPLHGAGPAPSRETSWQPPQHITGLSVQSSAMRNPDAAARRVGVIRVILSSPKCTPPVLLVMESARRRGHHGSPVY